MGRDDESWASDDDANDLLAGILDETEDDARSEQERIESELARKKRERERQEREELERKREEARARITAEEERLEGLAERKTMRQEALKVEELKEKGEYVEEEPEAQEEDVAEDEQPESGSARDEPQPTPEPEMDMPGPADHAPSNADSGNSIAYVVLAAVTLLVVGAGITAYLLTQGSYEPSTATYAKAVYKPSSTTDRQVSVGFTPVRETKTDDEDAPRPRREPPPAAKQTRTEKTNSNAGKGDSKEDKKSPGDALKGLNLEDDFSVYESGL
jgi:hypothetical protein